MSLLTAEQRRDQRLKAIAGVYQSVARMLSGQHNVTVSIAPSGPAAAWSNGVEITFNAGQITEDDTATVERMHGLHFHELCHVMWTPRAETALRQWVKSSGTMWAFNALEDQRIERLMVGAYPSVGPWLESCVLRWVISKDPSTLPLTHVLTYGRHHVNDDVRAGLRDVFVRPDLLQGFEAVIDAYIELVFPDDYEAAKPLIEEFSRLHRDLMASMPQGMEMPSSCASQDTTSGRPQPASAQRKAQDSAAQQDEDRNKQDQQEDQPSSTGKSGEDKDDEEGEGASSSDGEQGEQQENEDSGDQASGESSDGDDMGSSDAGGSGDDRDADDETESGSGSDAEDESGDSSADDSAGSGSGDADEAVDDAEADSSESSDEGDGESGDGEGQSGSDKSSSDVGDGADGDVDTDGAVADADEPGQGTSHGLSPEQVRNIITAAQAALDEFRESADIRDTVTDTVRKIRTAPGQFILEKAPYEELDVPATVAQMSKSVYQALRGLKEEADPGWHRAQPEGRFNSQRWSLQRDLDTAFDMWNEGVEDAVDIECVVLIDTSGSMAGNTIHQTYQAAHALKRALDRLSARTTILTFSWANDCKVVYAPEDKASPGKYRYYFEGGTTCPRLALEQAARILAYSNRKVKVLLTITDGAWDSTPSTMDPNNPNGWSFSTDPVDGLKSDEYVEHMTKAGVLTGLVYVGAYAGQQIEAHNHAVSMGVPNVSGVLPFAKSLVTYAVKRGLVTR